MEKREGKGLIKRCEARKYKMSCENIVDIFVYTVYTMCVYVCAIIHNSTVHHLWSNN